MAARLNKLWQDPELMQQALVRAEPLRIDGAKIRALRRERIWTQKELSVKSGVDQCLISDLETGKKTTSRIDTLVAIARTFGVPTESLLVQSASPPPVQPIDPLKDSILRTFKKLTPEERNIVITYCQFLVAQRGKRE